MPATRCVLTPEERKQRKALQSKARYAANREQIALRYKADRERRIAQATVWSAANRERVLANQRAWREANRERMAAQNKARREANPEKDSARNRAWKKAHPEYNAAKWAARRARKKRQACSCCTPAQFRQVYAFAQAFGLEVDHVEPLALGGLHCLKNLQPLTRKDHEAKTLEDLKRITP